MTKELLKALFLRIWVYNCLHFCVFSPFARSFHLSFLFEIFCNLFLKKSFFFHIAFKAERLFFHAFGRSRMISVYHIAHIIVNNFLKKEIFETDNPEKVIDCQNEIETNNVRLNDINEIISKFQSIVIFRWNREYPSDKFFNFDIQYYSMTLCEEFEGTSHEKITMEIYDKKG